MTANIEITEGACFCGAIKFTVEGEIPKVVYCHCSQCRKLSGHCVAAVSGVQGRTKIFGDVNWFQSSPGYERGFCQHCGTPVFWRDLARGHLSIMAGAFGADTKLSAQDHIFVADKAGYYPICDGLPQYDAGRE